MAESRETFEGVKSRGNEIHVDMYQYSIEPRTPERSSLGSSNSSNSYSSMNNCRISTALRPILCPICTVVISNTTYNTTNTSLSPLLNSHVLEHVLDPSIVVI